MVKATRRVLCLLVIWSSGAAWGADAAAADDRADQVKAFLRDTVTQPGVGVVVGLLDERRGTQVIGYCKPGEGRDQTTFDGDTVFEIGSITKTFTALLLQDMVERGQVQFDDPVAKLLPPTVKVPTFNGQPITLLHLATQSSGLPFNPDNASGVDRDHPLGDYSADRLYAFLVGYELKEEPGKRFSYSNIGFGLLGHALALRGGQDYERLVVERICRPLRMDDTAITLSDPLKRRLATGHDKTGRAVGALQLGVLVGTGTLRSTANDLLKYVAAQVGLPERSALTPLMERTHVIRFRGGNAVVRVEEGFAPGNTGMPWFDNAVEQPAGMWLMGHTGGTPGYSAFVGFDAKQRRGVVVLCNQLGDSVNPGAIGWVLLQNRPLTRQAVIDVLLYGREVVGIGVALDVDPATQRLRITKVYPNSPAAQAGLTAGQYIGRIGDVATAGKAPADCVALIRGPEGSTLRLEIVDADGKVNAVELTRNKVKL